MSSPAPIKLIKSTFYNEGETKRLLSEYLLRAPTLSMGEMTLQFEKMFAEKQGRRYAVFVNSGSSANLILIQALLNTGKLAKGARVGVSALTWATNIMPIIQLGLTPVALDCEPDTLNVSPRILEQSLESLDALFLTNVLGFSDDIRTIAELCERKGIVFIEDNCESLGSKVGGKLLGNFGLASTFSFFVGHHLSTVEGGMVATDDEDFYHALLMVRAHGWDRQLSEGRATALRALHGIADFYAKYTFYELAYNVRPTDIQSFIGTTQLQYWDAIVAAREKNYRQFEGALRERGDVMVPRTEHMDTVSNFALPVVSVNETTAERLKHACILQGIEIRPIIAGNITRQPFYQKYVGGTLPLPNSEHAHACGFYFGNNPEMTEEEIERIVTTIVEA